MKNQNSRLRNDRVRAFSKRVRLAVDSLEPRRLLCGLPHEFLDPAPTFSPALERAASANSGSGDAVSIVWSNRGASDRFSDVFGANANAARAVVDAVLADWGRAITSFNRRQRRRTCGRVLRVLVDGACCTFEADGRYPYASISPGRGGLSLTESSAVPAYD